MQLPPSLTLAQTPQALAGLRLALSQAASGVPFIVDASALAEFDTSAIALLLEAQRLARERGLGFGVAHVPAKLRQLAALYGVEDLLALQPPSAT
jgi:phospholipid transport system transporter-binding protein